MIERDRTVTDQRLTDNQTRPGNDATGPWLSLNEAADRLGIGVEALRTRIRRRHWATRKGNDGRTRVQLPPDALEPHATATEPQPNADQTRLDELRTALHETELELAYAQAAVETAKAVAAAEVAAKNELITELRAALAGERAALAEARRPWWWRLWGR